MEIKEKCNKCNIESKDSKGILNIHNIQTKDKEFENKLVDCKKCPDCGHSWIPKNIKDEN